MGYLVFIYNIYLLYTVHCIFILCYMPLYRKGSMQIHVIDYPRCTSKQQIQQLFENYGHVDDIAFGDGFSFVVTFLMH